jgi:hypothetical protein
MDLDTLRRPGRAGLSFEFVILGQQDAAGRGTRQAWVRRTAFVGRDEGYRAAPRLALTPSSRIEYPRTKTQNKETER